MSVSILFLDHAPALGGAERSLLLLLKHLDRAHWQPHLACAGGPLAERAAALGVPVHTVPLSRLRRSARAPLDWLEGVRAVARLARRIEATILMANTVRAALYAAPAARIAYIPFIWHMRDFWLSESRPRALWVDAMGKRALCAAARRVIANSRATAAHLPCPDKVVVVYNGIEVDRFDPAMDGSAFRQRHGIPPGAPLVGTVGRLRPWKGQDRFLRALARVREVIPDARGLVVGGSPFGLQDDYPQHLRCLAADLGLASCVVFTGQVADTRPALAAMDLFVHPGDPEPFGLVNLGAMAMAKPVVAFAHGALPEIVAQGETGLLVPPGDAAALARAVLALLGDPDRRLAMGPMGRMRVEAHFTAARMAMEVDATLWEAVQ
ncbi:MAG: glycosyltransferase family 4 protein [Anaerolineae bacterium]|nr:MAG: glycosyltransferase family 4 protein [Anaerolineae bacterium]